MPIGRGKGGVCSRSCGAGGAGVVFMMSFGVWPKNEE